MTRWTRKTIDDALEAIRGATEGPWFAQRNEPGSCAHVTTWDEDEGDEDGPVVASVFTAGGDGEQHNRNARFIAHARGTPATGTGYEAALLALGRVVDALDGIENAGPNGRKYAARIRRALEGDDDDRED